LLLEEVVAVLVLMLVVFPVVEVAAALDTVTIFQLLPELLMR
jgi:hypothetical protein